MTPPDAARPLVTMVGSLNLDIGVRVPRFPGPGETITGHDLHETPGGKSSNQAAAAARLGGTVRLVGAVGADHAGQYLLEEARRLGIDTRRIRRLADQTTGRALIQVDSRGENIITVIPGANEHVTAGDIDESALADSAVVGLALEIPVSAVLQAARVARRMGAISILNLSPFQEVPAELLALTDVLLVNEHEAARFMGQDSCSTDAEFTRLARRLDAAGIAAAVVTLGASGSVVLQRGAEPGSAYSVRRVPAFRAKAVDTTGCGDAFAGTVAAELASGATLISAVHVANAAGGFAAEHRGAQSSYADAGELRAWMEAAQLEQPAPG